MGVSEVEKYLITCLHLFGVEQDAIIGIMSVIDTEEEQIELMEWLDNHREATTVDILEKVVHMAQSQKKPHIQTDF